MSVYGLTGGIASGKSTVARLLAAKGAAVLDLDHVSRQVLAPGSEALGVVAERWPHVVQSGVLDRKALGSIVVADTEARRWLEGVTHPKIWAAMEAWVVQQRGVTIVEAALMVETGSWRRYDGLIVVACDVDVQRARLRAREAWDAEMAERWLAAQMPLADKVAVADFVIWNNGDVVALEAAVTQLWADLQPHP